MSRIQLALNVSNLNEAIEFYSKMFKVEPARLKPGYANFEIAEPPLKLILFDDGKGNTLNHLGVEVETADEVELAERRLSAEGLETTGVDDTACCFATKTETWVVAPDGQRWEWYVRTGDSEQLENEILGECCPNETNKRFEKFGWATGELSADELEPVQYVGIENFVNDIDEIEVCCRSEDATGPCVGKGACGGACA